MPAFRKQAFQELRELLPLPAVLWSYEWPEILGFLVHKELEEELRKLLPLPAMLLS